MLCAWARYLHTYPCASPPNRNTVSMQIRRLDRCLGSQRGSASIPPLFLEKSPNQGTSPEWHPRTKQLCCLLHTWHHTSILLSVRCLRVTNRRGKREHNEGGGVVKKMKAALLIRDTGKPGFSYLVCSLLLFPFFRQMRYPRHTQHAGVLLQLLMGDALFYLMPRFW